MTNPKSLPDAVERVRAYAEWLDDPDCGESPYGRVGTEVKIADLHSLLAGHNAAVSVAEMNATSGGFTARQLDAMTTRAEAAEAQLDKLETEKAAALAIFSELYVGTDLANIAKNTVKSWRDQAATICRLRGEADADEDLKRFVEYVDHAMHMSHGEVSCIIDFAQGQKARAESAQASNASLVGALRAIAGWEDVSSAEWDREFPQWNERFKRLNAHFGNETLAFRDLAIEIARDALRPLEAASE